MKCVIVDFRISKKCENTLKKMGYAIVKTPNNKNLQNPLCGHPDMVICKLSNHEFVAESTICGFLAQKFKNYTFIQGTAKLQPEYPFDISYNCARVANYLFCNKKYADKKILEYCIDNNIKILHTNQGYAKCSICIVSDNSIITADKNIFNVAKENNIDVLLIENTGIVLKGYNQGFIGGATGLLEKDLLCVNGNIELHKDYEAIKSFCLKYGVSIVSLSDEPVTDIGTIIRL